VTGSVRVLLVGEDPLARAGLAALLASQAGLAIVAQGAPADDLAALAAAQAPDVVLWDLGIEPGEGVGTLPELGDEAPPVVVLVANESQAVEALAAGARGALFRDVPADRLAAAISAAAQGLLVLEPPLAETALRPRPSSSGPALDPLTPREIEVLQLLAQGLSNKAIAARLGISEHTAKFHVNSILGKLDASTRTEAVVAASRLGLVVL
jgi:DNA-binding NarL/FixJ family response regulator